MPTAVLERGSRKVDRKVLVYLQRDRLQFHKNFIRH